MSANVKLSGGALDVAIQMFRRGMIEDGDLASKVGRSELCAAGYAVAADGWQALTGAGFLALLASPGFYRWMARCRLKQWGLDL